MQLILGLFLTVATAAAMAQQYGTAYVTPVPDAARPPSEPPGPATAASMSTRAVSLPDAPSYATGQSSNNSANASTSEPTQIPAAVTNSLAVGPRTTPLSPMSKQFLGLAAPNSVGYSSLIFVGTSTVTEAGDAHRQSDGSMTGSGNNCGRGIVEKADGNRWITSLLSITSNGGHYCALGEGGFWKRGTYAATRAFAAHKYDSANSYNSSEHFFPGIAPGVPASYYYSYQGYAGDRLAARYASAVGRDALRNMFREFWPDISTHVLHRRP